MKKKIIEIHPDIRIAKTMHRDFYMEDSYFEKSKESIFLNHWTYAGYIAQMTPNQTTLPFYLYPGFLDIPLLWTKQNSDTLSCISNVCTHRAKVLTDHPGHQKKITCPYHGRRFNLAGKMEFMPEFKEALDFPSACDHLEQIPYFQWKELLFINPKSNSGAKEILHTLDKYLGFESVENYVFSELHSKSYAVQAHWALYCENYLEGFHIPFVHKELNEILDYGKYEVLCLDDLILQIGYAEDPNVCFDLAPEHPLFGEQIAAFYVFIYPNVMLNFYNWGLSVNIVEPIRKDLTKVHFKTFIKDQKEFDNSGAAALIDKVEREDEYVVESVQRGLRSPYYQQGRYSPKREVGVHHFHHKIASSIED